MKARGKPAFGPQNNLQIVSFDKPIGRVYHPDGKITENVNKVLLRRNPDDTVKTSYPITDGYVKYLMEQFGEEILG